MNMVEKVARALCDQGACVDGLDQKFEDCPYCHGEPTQLKDDCTSMARAAIKAMRTPTTGMLTEGGKALLRATEGRVKSVFSHELLAQHETVIDEALKE